MIRRWLSWTLACFGLLLLGCSSDLGRLETSSRNLAGGQVETGYEATGFIKIHIIGDPRTRFRLCTATLIRADAILTAAHCFKTGDADPEWDSAQFYLGSFRDPDQGFDVRKVVVHPNYTKPGTTDHAKDDIAIAFLQQHSTGIKPATVAGLEDGP